MDGSRHTDRPLVAAVALIAALLTAWSLATAEADAAFPFPTNGKIACGGLRGADADLEIFDVNPNGSGERLLTNNGFRDGSPAYSPDGTKIAFESGRNRILGQPDNTEIYVANNDGNLTGPDVRRLTFNNGRLPNGTLSALAATDFSPSWSPNGQEIVFHSGRTTTFTDSGTSPTNDFEIYKMSATTGEVGLTQAGAPVNPATRLTFNRGQDAIPSWSPDGTKIAFQAFPPNNPTNLNNNLEIFTINPDGSDRTNLSQNPGTPDAPGGINENLNGLDRDVIWSSDSQRLAWNSARAGQAGNQNNDVWRMNRDGSNKVRLTTGQDSPAPAPFTDYDVPLVWSPDNSTLLIASSRASTSEQTDFFAYTMDPNVPDSVSSTPLTRIEQFQRCDWTRPQAAQVTPPRPTYPYPVPDAGFPGCPTATANVIRGTNAANNITGTAAADRIFGGTGNDIVNALAGNDCVDLGTGGDLGQGGVGNDLMIGGLGADRMAGDAGNDVINGNPDNDNLNGGTGNDRVFGDAGNDGVAGGSGNDRLHGVGGNDRVSGAGGRDRINGGAGTDRISAGSSADRVAGDQGSDRVSGNSGNDSIAGNSGNDRLSGGSGGDSISGGDGNDRISARDGRRDRITCGRGRDSVTADRADRVSRNCERVRRR